ncbi:hypothetical protein ACIQCX_21405 [Enterobacter cancerogenus]
MTKIVKEWRKLRGLPLFKDSENIGKWNNCG